EPHGYSCNKRRLLGRFGKHCVSRRQSRRNLSGEDRERKVPRRNARKYATATQRQLIALSCYARQRLGIIVELARVLGVVAQIVDCLTPFVQRVLHRPPRFPDKQRKKPPALTIT